MKKQFTFPSIFIALLACLCWTACTSTNTQENTTKALDSTTIEIKSPDTSIFPLPDSLFALKDIKSTLITKRIEYDTDDKCWYRDNGNRLPLIKLTDKQKMKLVASCPGLASNGGTEWIMGDWQINFVSKQRPIGDFNPIIVSTGGTDFGGLLYILLNKSNSPVSYLLLHGGECGEWHCGIKHSYLNGDSITTYEINSVSGEFEGKAIVDSISYLSIILPNGEIETNRTDSSRYERVFKEEDFK
ncbi:MAG: hypothetical protein H6607_10915 [Flavobacteriales bacterium]|nr:hypothetical protein [Flavobacteriales bacterium]